MIFHQPVIFNHPVKPLLHRQNPPTRVEDLGDFSSTGNFQSPGGFNRGYTDKTRRRGLKISPGDFSSTGNFQSPGG
jgi:hypothetical protein